MYDLLIIGGGASGLAAGITATQRGKKTLIFEKEEKVGKKILVTGNGKCNLSATDVGVEKYNNSFFLNVCDVDVVAFFHRIGLATKVMDNRIYPYSESALSVLNAMRKAYTGEIRLGEEVKEIQKEDGFFIINGVRGKNVLLATGSNATKGTNSLYLYQKFGHAVTPLRPSIVPLKTDDPTVKGMANLRVKGRISLVQNGKFVYAQDGEILWKNNGISGIASMMLSTYIARNGGKFDVSVDLVPDKTEEEIADLTTAFGAESFVCKAVAQSVEKQAKDRKIPLEKCMKDFRIYDVKNGDIANAQVVCGGLKIDEFDENCMSKLQKGLYAAGEALDVDGECGGYNLHFAFAGGIKVGERC